MDTLSSGRPTARSARYRAPFPLAIAALFAVRPAAGLVGVALYGRVEREVPLHWSVTVAVLAGAVWWFVTFPVSSARV